MPLGPFGSVTLDGVRFSTDPAIYEPLNWPKRQSVNRAIGGAVTIQDFGVVQKDNTVRLASGSANVLDGTIVAALHTRFRTRGATYVLTDWLDNQFTVFILSFRPVAVKQGRDVPAAASITLYTYDMELHVLGITRLLGVAYSGS